MYSVLSITLPFFAIIFLGTFFRYRNIFDHNSSKILTKYTLYVALPPFMFVNILKASNDVVFDFNFILRFEIITLFLLFLTFFISFYILKNDRKKSSLFALNSSYPNYGYMGIPLCILAFGENAAVPISLILLIDTIVLLSFTSFFIEFDNRKSFHLEFIKLIKKMLNNPILLAAIIGFFFVTLNIQVPDIIFTFLEIIAFAATPTALFAIGINLFNKFDKKNYSNVLIICFFKLLIHPLLIYLIFIAIPHNIPPLWIKVAILSACLPVAGNVFAMSIYYNSFKNSTSGSVFITTILATFSVPTVLFLLLI